MKKVTDMTTGNPAKLLLQFALPVFLGNIFQLMFTMVDKIIVGQFVGAEAFSAVGATNALGNINASFDEPTTNVSNFSFVAEDGDRVKFSFQSDISAGELEIIVCSSNGSVVYVLDHAKSLETFFTFDSADTYTLQAEYTDFIGSFKIAVYSANKN